MRTTEKVDTIADGIAVRVPVKEALSDLSSIVDDVLLVDDRTMVLVMRLLFYRMGLVVEPAGAAGVAALLAHRERFAGALVATPLCGANLTKEQVRRWLLEDVPGGQEKDSP
jgi:threonine dehydratase